MGSTIPFMTITTGFPPYIRPGETPSAPGINTVPSHIMFPPQQPVGSYSVADASNGLLPSQVPPFQSYHTSMGQTPSISAFQHTSLYQGQHAPRIVHPTQMSAAGPQYCYVPSEGTGPIVVPTPSQLGSGQYVQQHPYAAYQQQYYYPPAKPKPAAPKRIPRPANSFMTYRMEKQYQVLAENAGVNNKDISVIIGEMWRNEPEEVKEYYRKKAEIGRREHMLRYPDYKYTPLKKRKQSVTKKNLPKINTKPPLGTNSASSAGPSSSSVRTPRSAHSDARDLGLSSDLDPSSTTSSTFASSTPTNTSAHASSNTGLGMPSHTTLNDHTNDGHRHLSINSPLSSSNPHLTNASPQTSSYMGTMSGQLPSPADNNMSFIGALHASLNPGDLDEDYLTSNTGSYSDHLLDDIQRGGYDDRLNYQ